MTGRVAVNSDSVQESERLAGRGVWPRMATDAIGKNIEQKRKRPGPGIRTGAFPAGSFQPLREMISEGPAFQQVFRESVRQWRDQATTLTGSELAELVLDTGPGPAQLVETNSEVTDGACGHRDRNRDTYSRTAVNRAFREGPLMLQRFGTAP